MCEDRAKCDPVSEESHNLTMGHAKEGESLRARVTRESAIDYYDNHEIYLSAFLPLYFNLY